jgi:hypothetical protein
LTVAGIAVLPLEQGLPIGSPGVWTVTVRFGATPIGSKTVLITPTVATASTDNTTKLDTTPLDITPVTVASLTGTTPSTLPILPPVTTAP